MSPRSFSFFVILIIPLFLALTTDTDSQYRVATAAESVCTGDLNSDGFKDIVVGNNFNTTYGWGGISILRNLGWGNFSFADSVYSYSNEWSVGTSNLDTVPNNEILFSRYDPVLDLDYIGIVFNGSCNDTLYLNTTRDGGMDCIGSGDVDGNGMNDIVFACNQKHFWGIFYNYGNRVFSSPVICNVNYYPSGLAIGDLNNDGRDDVVLCGQIIDVYFSYPSGLQNLQLNAEGFAGGVSVIDFNGDGLKDILAGAGFGQTSLIIYKNLGNQTFQKLPSFVFQPLCGPFFAGDFDNDGLPDVLFMNHESSGYYLWYNLGNFTLGDSTFISVPGLGEQIRNFTCDDFDNNSYLDFVTIRTYFGLLPTNVDIRFNDGNGHFLPNPIVGIHDLPDAELSAPVCFPNPFSDHATIQFRLDRKAWVEISVVDLNGEEVSALNTGIMASGVNRILWDGSDAQGKRCRRGIYLVKISVNGGYQYTAKLLFY